MKFPVIQPQHVNYLTGKITGENVIKKCTLMGSLEGVFSDTEAYAAIDPNKQVYSVEMLSAPEQEGELFFGVSHLEPGLVGEEFHMTRGHFHQRIEQAEYYFGVQGEGLLILQHEDGTTSFEKVFAGSIHHISGHVAHRLINIGETRLSALAVWPTVAGHDYGTLKQDGFNALVVKDQEHGYKIIENPKVGK